MRPDPRGLTLFAQKLLFICTLALLGCSGGGHDALTPAPSGNHSAAVAALRADSPSRHIAAYQLDEVSLGATGYIYTGTAPGATRTFRVIPADGVALTAHWSVEGGAFETSTEASGLEVRWTAPMEERAEGRIRVSIDTPDGSVERLFRVNVETSPAETPYVVPAPLADVDLYDPIVEEGAADTYKVAQDELLVTFTNDLGDEDDRRVVIDALGCQVISKIVGMETYQLYHPAGGDLWAVIDAFAALPFVSIAEPNCMRYIDVVPNDPNYNLQYCHPLQSAVEGWDVGKGAPDQIVAIMDTGTGRQHPDLAAKCVDGEDFVTPIGDGLGGDQLGDGVDNNGFNGVDEGTGHGVHCSGISAAISDNGVGGAGMAWDTKVMGLRIFPINGDDGASSSSILNAINFITSYNNNVANVAKIVACNQSIGGGGSSTTEQNAINAAMATGCTFAASAGNSNTSQMSYPGAYPMLIGVAATDDDDVRASFSNFGTWVDVSACGVQIFNTYLEGAPGEPNPWVYAYLSGTSMSAPQVSGLIALIKGNAPSLTAAEVKDQILNTTDNIDAENPNYVGRLGTGRINVFRALTQEFVVELEADGSVTLDDSDIEFARGNRDGRINPGERVNLLPAIENVGLRGGTNIGLVIDDPTDPWISFATSSITIASITRSGMTSDESFPLMINRAAPDNYEKNFTYTVTDPTSGAGPWNFSFRVRIEKDDPATDTVPGTAGDLTGGTLLRPVTNQPFFFLDLVGDANYLTLNKLKVSMLGDADPASVTNIRLWLDDGDGNFDGVNGDTELGLKSYLNPSFQSNFDRQSDPSAGMGRPQDRDIYPGATLVGGAVEFAQVRLPVVDTETVRLFVSADISLAAVANSTIGLAVLADTDVEVSAGDSLTGFPWGSVVAPVIPSWGGEGVFAQVGDSSNWRGRAAIDDDGHLYVVYDSSAWPDFDIYMRHSTDGGLSWGPETSVVGDGSNDFYPDVAVGPGDDVYITWYTTRHSQQNREIYFKRSTDNGQTWGADTRVTNQTRNSRVPRITYGAGAIRIVWFDEVAAQGDYKIYYTESDTQGTSWSAFEPVSTTPGNRVAEEPMIALAGTELYCAWHEYEGSFGQPGNNYRVLYTHKADGAPSWGTPRQLTDPGIEDAYGVKIAPTSNGKAYAVYHSDVDGDFDIWMQVLNGDATDITEQVTDDFGDSNFPVIVRSDSGRIDIAFGNAPDSSTSNIFHVTRPTDGDPWEEAKQLSTNVGHFSNFPAFLRDQASGNMWCFWNDDRSGITNTWYNTLLF